MANGNLKWTRTLLVAMGAQQADEALRLLAPGFIQHAPDMPDGREGLRQAILEARPGALAAEIIRTVQDGPYVVAQLQAHAPCEDIFAVLRFGGVGCGSMVVCLAGCTTEIKAVTRR